MAWDTGSKHNKLFRRSRTQLTVWYTGVIAIVLSLSGLGMYEAISHAHRVTADRELKAVAETVRTVLKNDLSDNGLIDSFPDSLMPNLCLAESNCLTSLEEVRPLSANTNHQNNFYFVLLNPNEEPIAIAGNFPEGVPIFNPASSIIVLRDKQGNSYRQIAISLNSQNGQTPMGTLFVGRSFSDFATYLDMILWIVVLSLTLTTGVIAFASWWLAGLAIKPVEFAYRQIQDFTADAAHELRTPLSAVRATAESVVRLPQISEIEAREALQVISRQNQRLANLVSDLLLLSRLDTQPPPPFSQCCLQDLLSDIEEEMAALAIANNIHLKLNQFKTTRITVMGNEDHLYRLILNVVSNALQHTPDDGEVSIQLHQIGGSAWITVQDSGVGISLEDQKRIFDRFYRVDKNRSRRGGGSGLGLSIAKAIAQTHNGTLSVSSELKKGSTFSICLPVSNK